MRGKAKLVSLVTTLAVLLVSSMVFASGLMNVSTMSLFSGPIIEPDNPGTPNIFFDPAKTRKDYLRDPSYQIGGTFSVSVNISEVTDLYTYQVNVTWTPGILNFTGIVSYGDLLAKTTSPYGTSRIEPTSSASNVTGYASIAETILGNYGGVTSATGGRLFTIQFKIVGYGWTELKIGVAGTLPTLLLDSLGAPITPFTTTSGWFDNRLHGDSDSSHAVTVSDIGEVSDRWTSPPGVKPYSWAVDWDNNGVITVSDIGEVSDNWGRTAP